MTIIIMPTNTTTTRNCIIQNNTTYCEKKDMTNKEFGVSLFIIAIIIAWVHFWMYIGVDKGKGRLALYCGVFAPLIIGGIILYFI